MSLTEPIKYLYFSVNFLRLFSEVFSSENKKTVFHLRRLAKCSQWRPRRSGAAADFQLLWGDLDPVGIGEEGDGAGRQLDAEQDEGQCQAINEGRGGGHASREPGLSYSGRPATHPGPGMIQFRGCLTANQQGNWSEDHFHRIDSAQGIELDAGIPCHRSGAVIQK